MSRIQNYRGSLQALKRLRLEDDESFDEFYTKLKDIVNSAFNLRETIPEPKIVRKCLDLYSRDSMQRSPRLRNQRILTRFL